MMITVNSLEKKDNSSLYIVIINEKKYLLDEEVVLKYRLFKNSIVEDDIINEIIEYNDYINYYNKALDYSIKYNKPSKMIYNYLIDKGCSDEYSKKIIDELINKKILNDKLLCKNQIYYLINSFNGKLLIEKKLFEKGFDKIMYQELLNDLDYELYYSSLIKCVNKNKDKYKKYDKYKAKEKLKSYLIGRGYTFSDLDTINFNSLIEE